MKYIAYGSNMSREQMTYRCPDAKLIGVGRIDRARLEFYLHATVEYTRFGADSVPVAVWEITREHERALDHYEGFPHYYRKIACTVDMGGEERIQGMAYQMCERDFFPPAIEYFRGIRDAYEDLGLRSEIKQVLQPALMRSYRLARW